MALQSLPEECNAAYRLAHAVSDTLLRMAPETAGSLDVSNSAVAMPILWWSQSAQAVLQAVHEDCEIRSSAPPEASVLQLSCWRALHPEVSYNSELAEAQEWNFWDYIQTGVASF